jgi:FKBP-type peptidyl-prolyl cis-trans isomerase
MIRAFRVALGAFTLATANLATAAPVMGPVQSPVAPDFLAQNAKAKGVITTPSGLQYQVVTSGPTTGQHPGPHDMVNLDYEVTLLNGQVIDSSFARGEPLTGTAGDFVPGFTEALELMRPGDEWIVWVPPQLGYGAKDSGPIPGNSVLRFRLALHSVTSPN